VVAAERGAAGPVMSTGKDPGGGGGGNVYRGRGGGGGAGPVMSTSEDPGGWGGGVLNQKLLHWCLQDWYSQPYSK